MRGRALKCDALGLELGGYNALLALTCHGERDILGRNPFPVSGGFLLLWPLCQVSPILPPSLLSFFITQLASLDFFASAAKTTPA